MKGKGFLKSIGIMLVIVFIGCDLAAEKEPAVKNAVNDSIVVELYESKMAASVLSESLVQVVTKSLDAVLLKVEDSNDSHFSRSNGDDSQTINSFELTGDISGKITISGEYESSIDSVTKKLNYSTALTIVFDNYSKTTGVIIDSGSITCSYAFTWNSENVYIIQRTSKGNLVQTINNVKHLCKIDLIDSTSFSQNDSIGYDNDFTNSYTVDGNSWVETEENSFSIKEMFVGRNYITSLILGDVFSGIYSLLDTSTNPPSLNNKVLDGITGKITYNMNKIIFDQTQMKLDYSAKIEDYTSQPSNPFMPSYSGDVSITSVNLKNGTFNFTGNATKLALNFDKESPFKSLVFDAKIDSSLSEDGISITKVNVTTGVKSYYFQMISKS